MNCDDVLKIKRVTLVPFRESLRSLRPYEISQRRKVHTRYHPIARAAGSLYPAAAQFAAQLPEFSRVSILVK